MLLFCPPTSISKNSTFSSLSLWQKLTEYLGSFFKSKPPPHEPVENQHVKKEEHEERRDSGLVLNDSEDEESCSLVASVSVTKTRKRLSFYETPAVHTTWSKHEYNRKPMPKRYSLKEILQIKEEINRYKQLEMISHPESQQNVHLY